MKVLFLDHYGVLCLSKRKIVRTELSMPTSDEFDDITFFSDFDKDAVGVLNDLIEKTGAEIVVSSDWKREITLSGMCDFYKKQGIKKMPIDYTPWLPGYPTYHEQRAAEINIWLNERNDVDKWISVDDLYMGTWLANFVWAKNVHLGIKDADVRLELINRLNAQ